MAKILDLKKRLKSRNGPVNRFATGHRKPQNKNYAAHSERAAVANRAVPDLFDRMLLESGVKSHMRKLSARVRDKVSCNSSSLSDELSIHEASKGALTVQWITESGKYNISLSETLFAPKIAKSPLGICLC